MVRRGWIQRPGPDYDRVEFSPSDFVAQFPVEIVLNGEPCHVPAGASAAHVLELLVLGGRRIAVEVNGEIVPRGRYVEHELKPGDRVEIVHAVGGG